LNSKRKLDTRHAARSISVMSDSLSTTLDHAAFSHNLRQIRRRIGPRVKLLLAVKKNAYGHGAVEIARTAQWLGVDWLGVFCAGEGAQLREHGIRLPILVFSTTPAESLPLAILNRLTLTITDLATARTVHRVSTKLNQPTTVHLKLDTGMGRLGFAPGDVLKELPRMLRCRHLRIEGVYSHLASAESDLPYSRQQLARLLEFVRRAPCRFDLVHLGASSALPQPGFHLDMIRVGIAAYGGHHTLGGFRPVLRVTAPVLQVKDVPAGSRLSYGGTVRTSRRSRIALIGAGYGDGYPRALSNRGWVWLHGKRAPVVGRVCMDQFLVDVTRIRGVAVGQEAELIGPSVPVARLAEAADTISYELLCSLGNCSRGR
jgi:alanine racemase